MEPFFLPFLFGVKLQNLINRSGINRLVGTLQSGCLPSSHEKSLFPLHFPCLSVVQPDEAQCHQHVFEGNDDIAEKVDEQTSVTLEIAPPAHLTYENGLRNRSATVSQAKKPKKGNPKDDKDELYFDW